MFQQRQRNDILQLSEVSKATISPGAVGNGSTVYVAVAFTAGGNAATFALGDTLTIIPSAGANANGVQVQAVPTATAGTAGVYFTNNTGASVTPTAGASYTIVADRITPTLI